MHLDLESTDALLKELLSRFEHHVFVGMNTINGDTIETRRHWDGCAHTVCGLCVDIQENVMVALRQSESDRE